MSRRKKILRLKETILAYPKIGDDDISIKGYVPPRINTDPLNEKKRSFEFHVPLGNFCGPGTDIRRRLAEKVMPTSRVDRQCVSHDIDYWNARQMRREKKMTNGQLKKFVRDSDERLMAVAKYNIRHPTNIVDKMHGNLTFKGIKAKTIGEDLGLISPMKFIGGSKKKKRKDPARRLKKRLLKGK